MVEFKTVINRIVDEHTEYSSISDMDYSDTIEINSSTAIMDLVVERDGINSEVTVAHYLGGDSRRPDPEVTFKYPSFEPIYLEDTTQQESNSNEIKDFLSIWGDILQAQFL